MKFENDSLALRRAPLFELMNSRGRSSMLSIEWVGRVSDLRLRLVDECDVLRGKESMSNKMKYMNYINYKTD